MWRDLGTALCLVLVIEGLLPFLSPRAWREGVLQLARLSERSLRLMGGFAMLVGVVALYLIR